MKENRDKNLFLYTAFLHHPPTRKDESLLYIYSYNVRKMLDKYLSTDIHHRPRAHPGEHARNENFFPNLKGLNIRIERSRNRDQQKTKEGGRGKKEIVHN